MAMSLSDEHRSALQDIRDNHKNLHFKRRATILLHLDAGDPTQAIAKRMGLASSTVLRWRRAFLAKGMAVFPGLKPSTKPSKSNGKAASSPSETAPAQSKKEALNTNGASSKKKKKKKATTRKRAKRFAQKEKAAAKAAAKKKAQKKQEGINWTELEERFDFKKKIKKLRKATKSKPVAKYVKQLKRRRKTLRSILDSQDRKTVKRLKPHLKALNKHIKRAESVLDKLKK